VKREKGQPQVVDTAWELAQPGPPAVAVGHVAVLDVGQCLAQRHGHLAGWRPDGRHAAPHGSARRPVRRCATQCPP